MTVERGVGGGAAAADDQFPVGMRVLAVDDDPTCLLLLETLLRRCQYHVTTTSQAIKALDMLRRNKFDLVISDVHMPEMDGFKLLEHVGLEMDLPVIMLSANSDPKLVMKGITHGACDYLLKPVRIEELKNIWQHVVRRRKFDSKERNNSENKEKPPHGSDEGTTDQRLGKRRKDQNEDEDEEHDDSGQENEDSTAQKKPRVVWSVDLHQKFVAAVNQLGIDKAVPKKILDLMNVEKLTRENVASHLQKYRLYLKKISTVANQQANMVAALGSTDTSYLHMNSMSGLGFHSLTGSTQLQSASLRSIPPSGILSRLNSPAGLGIRGLQSPGVIQLSPAQTTSQSSNSKSLFQPVVHGGSRGNIFQGRPMSLELDQVQSNKGITFPREFPTGLEDKTAFPIPNGFPDARMFSGSSNSPLHGIASKTLMLEGCHQGPQDVQQFGKQSSVAAAALNSGFSSHVSDLGRSTDSWSSVVQSTGMQSNLFTPRQGVVCPGNITDSISTMAFASGSDVASMLSVQLEDSKGGLRCQLSSSGGNAGQVINNNPQGWDNHRQEANILSNALCSSVTPFDGAPSPLGQNFDTNTPISHGASSFSPVGQSNFVDNILLKHDTANSALDPLVLKDGYMMGQQKLQNNYISSNFSSFEDLVVGMADRDQDRMRLAEGEFGSGAYPVRTCI